MQKGRIMFGFGGAAAGSFAAVPAVATPNPLSDLIRLALILIPGIFIIGITLVVLVKYARTWWTDRALANAQGVKSRWRGLLPNHVVFVSISYIGLALMPVTSAISRLREPLYSWPRSLAYSAFMLVGIYSLVSVIRHQKAKMVSIERLSYRAGSTFDDVDAADD